MSAGRPTLYSPEQGEQVIALMREGLSITAAAGEIGVHRDTIYTWAEAHPEFSDALKLGRAVRLLFWERAHIRGDLKPATTIFALKNASSEEWRERIVHAGDPDAPLQHAVSPSEQLLGILNDIAERSGE